MIPAATAIGAAEFSALMARLGGFEPRPLLAVAVSGGADSLALCLLCHDWAGARDGSVLALTVDHRLRRDSTAEAMAVGAALGARGIGHRVLTWSGDKPATGLQEAARTARYRLLIDYAAHAGALHLLLAHHREDQAETLLLRLARGSGADGLAAMAAVREVPELRLLRPLLDQPKARLMATCAAAGLSWVEDPSNAAPRFARGRLRAARAVLDREGLTAAGLAVTAHRLGETRAALDDATARVLGRCCVLDPAGFAWLDREALLAAPVEIGRRALARCLATIGGAETPPRRERLDHLYETLGARTLAGCRLVPRAGRLLVVREAAACAAALPLAPGERVWWDRRFRVGLESRPHSPGLSVGALGDEGWRCCREAITDEARRRVPEPARASLPALRDEAGVLAVPHLGFTRADTRLVADLLFVPATPLAGPPFGVASAKPGII